MSGPAHTKAWNATKDAHGGWDGKPVYTRVSRSPAGASPCGAMDMLGNQYELTCEWFEPYPNNPEWQKVLSCAGSGVFVSVEDRGIMA